MKKDLLLIIDMQNVYAKGGQWCCPNTEDAAQRVKTMIDSERIKNKAEIVFTRFLASKNPVGVWKNYNVENQEVNEDAYANEMLEIFQEDVKQYPLYTKSVYSSLDIPEVLAAAKEAERVVVTGVVAECCVLFTVTALIDAGVKVIYLTDGVAGLNEQTEQAVETVLAGLEPLHVERMTIEQYLNE